MWWTIYKAFRILCIPHQTFIFFSCEKADRPNIKATLHFFFFYFIYNWFILTSSLNILLSLFFVFTMYSRYDQYSVLLNERLRWKRPNSFIYSYSHPFFLVWVWYGSNERWYLRRHVYIYLNWRRRIFYKKKKRTGWLYCNLVIVNIISLILFFL